MRSSITTALGLSLSVLFSGLALANVDTGVTGGGQALRNRQPSLALTYFVPLTGSFPGRDEGFGVGVQTLANIRLFAGNFAPGDALSANGQLRAIGQNTALFSLLGTNFGGDGITTFALPDLSSRTVVHTGSGPWQIGETRGIDLVSLTQAQLPAHTHAEPSASGMTGSTGANQPFTNTQPSLGLNYVIATSGVFAGPDNGTGGQTFVGQMGLFAGNFAPTGWAFADGQTLAITGNDALFTLIGTTYGGNGQDAFALPDLRGRTVVGTGAGAGLSPWALGQIRGAEDVTLTQAEMPAHLHTLAAGAGVTGVTGGSQPFDNTQPSIGLTYLISTQGLFPPRDGGSLSGATYLGELSLFAADFAPRGWALADGRLLPIGQNTALFSLLGTTYGGDGITTFALPDLRGRSVVGAQAGLVDVGDATGLEMLTLTVAELPSHLHSSSVPLPAGLCLFGSACGGLFGLRLTAKRCKTSITK